MPSLPQYCSSDCYLIALRALHDLIELRPELADYEAYLLFTKRFPTMHKPEDFQFVLETLKDLLIEFPDTTEPDAVSAKHQARAVLKRYAEYLNPPPQLVSDGDA